MNDEIKGDETLKITQKRDLCIDTSLLLFNSFLLV
jgi:hypothetical protein